MLCADCSGGVDDDELSPYGPLSSHLLIMAGQRPVNTREYIVHHAGSSPMFPLAYPVPPEPLRSPSDKHSSTTAVTPPPCADPPVASVSEQSAEKVASRQCTKRPDKDLLMDYLLATCNQNKRVAQQCQQQSSLPGPKATPLHARDIPQLVRPLLSTQRDGFCTICMRATRGHSDVEEGVDSELLCVCCEYVVCEKTDGERAVLVASPGHGGELYFVHRNMAVQRLEVTDTETVLQRQQADELASWLQSLAGLTVLDGELVHRHDRPDASTYLVFDAVFVDGNFVGTSPRHNLLNRLECAQRWLDASVLSKVPLPGMCSFQCKHFFPAAQIERVTSCFSVHAMGDVPPAATDDDTDMLSLSRQSSVQSSVSASDHWGWVYTGEATVDSTTTLHRSDGLVFTPVCKNYYEYLAIKWKPPNMCTVDFAINLNELQRVCRGVSNSGSGVCVDGYVCTSGQRKDSLVLLSQINIDITQARAALANSTWTNPSKPTGGTSGIVIAECMFDTLRSGWFAVKLRTDRSSPNTLRTAWANLEVIAEGLTLDMLSKLVRDATQAARCNVGVKGSDDPSRVGAHYDRIQHQRKSGDRDDRIAVHRKVMNWAKACLLHLAMSAQYRGLTRQPSVDLQYHISTDVQVSGSEGMEDGVQPYEMCTTDSTCAPPSPISRSNSVGTTGTNYDTYMLSTDGGSRLLNIEGIVGTLSAAAEEAGLLCEDIPRVPPDLRQSIPSGSFQSSAGRGRGRGRGGREHGGGRVEAINVLDIACGRGGDTKKFTSDHNVDLYVGVDISTEQVKECGERVAGNKRIKRSEMFLGDAAEGQWLEVTDSAPVFDIAWCMFALHYFCDTEVHCRALLSHVSHSLKPGGRFVTAFPNPCSVHRNLTMSTCLPSSTHKSEEATCNIASVDSHEPFTGSLADCLSSFGIEYRFSLGDAVEVCMP